MTKAEEEKQLLKRLADLQTEKYGRKFHGKIEIHCADGVPKKKKVELTEDI